ncbi:MAG: glycosyltransferase family 39 protein, partial [Chloroflexi bacterium]|nr:glycosyltransferase family 39 protein [Chloroflexota bacterium]
GRDGLNYIIYFIDIWAQKPVYQLLMLRRTPMAPVLYGGSLTLWGSVVTEILSAVFYCISIILLYRLASHFGTKTGMAVALLVNFYPAYGSLYHVVASEPPATFFLIVICVLFFDAIDTPRIYKFVLLGVGCVLATLSRPDSVVLLGLAVGPFLFATSTLRDKLRFSIIFLTVAISLLLCWSTYNYLRYDDFTLARGEKSEIPLERAFTFAHIVKAENGPASADLAKLVSTQLLDKEPYLSYHINSEIFFSQGTQRMFSDLIPLSDRYYGWDSDYNRLREVGIEAIKAHPVAFFWGYMKSCVGMLIYNPTWPVATRQNLNHPVVLKNAQNLPIPTEGELIPRSYTWWNSTSPDERAQPLPNSIELRFINPEYQIQVDEFTRKLIPYQAMLPNRDGTTWIADFLNQLTLFYPPPIFWLTIGLVGLFYKPLRYKYMLFLIIGISAIMIFYPILGIGAQFMMRTRFDPYIILFGSSGISEILGSLYSWQKKIILEHSA